MDYFKRMAQPSADFSVFKPKRSKKTEEQESSVKNTDKPSPKETKGQEEPVEKAEAETEE